jgi:predicted PurR-regulated permease PerM
MSALAVGRFRLAPALTAVVLTVLLLWLFGTAAEIFLLLFISVLISLYLSAGADVIQRNSGMPRLGAFWITVALSLLAVVALFWTLVPPVVEQTQSLIRVLPETIVKWETGLERFIARVPALQTVIEPGEHRVLAAVYEQVSGYFNDVLPKVASVLHGAINIFAMAIMALRRARRDRRGGPGRQGPQPDPLGLRPDHPRRREG